MQVREGKAAAQMQIMNQSQPIPVSEFSPEVKVLNNEFFNLPDGKVLFVFKLQMTGDNVEMIAVIHAVYRQLRP